MRHSCRYNEVNDCGTLPGCRTPKEAGKQVGHFTALIWKGATKLGCGIGTASGQPFYVCRYKAGDTLSGDTPNVAYGDSFNQNVPAGSGMLWTDRADRSVHEMWLQL
jgi:hypothetical protein